MADAAKLIKEIKSGKNPLKDNILVDGKSGGESKYQFMIEAPQQGVEPFYFWVLNMFQKSGAYGLGYKRTLKIKDIYSATETSAYWGDVEARRAIQQDRFEKYMANIGGMTKSLIQMLRDLRILEERLSFYYDAEEGKEGSLTALKTIWTDLVEGKSPTSVFALAGQPGYVTLPDLFFSNPGKNIKEIEFLISKLEMTDRVKSVLLQKLTKFIKWKENTFKELKQRWRFQLRYLKQHMQVIKLYISWIRPYLKNISKLQTGTSSRAELVKAFDTSVIELEVLGIDGKETEEGKIDEFKSVIRVKFDFTTIPTMAYQEGQSRGAIHMGKTKITIEGTVANDAQIKEYIKHQEEQDMELLTTVNESLDEMKEEFEHYMKKADELSEGEAGKPEKEKKEKEPKEGFFEPFTGVYKGFKETFWGTEKVEKADKGKKLLSTKEEIESLEKAVNKTKGTTYAMYYVFKKSFGMITE